MWPSVWDEPLRQFQTHGLSGMMTQGMTQWLSSSFSTNSRASDAATREHNEVICVELLGHAPDALSHWQDAGVV